MDDSASLPSSPSLINSLLASLRADSRNDRSSLSSRQKDSLLALHALFPAYLLDALDLLDRGLVTRLAFAGDDSLLRECRKEYFVQSTRHFAGSYKGGGRQVTAAGEGYHVRLRAWHCSCPGFAYAAFATAATLDPSEQDDLNGDDDSNRVASGEQQQQQDRQTGTQQEADDHDDPDESPQYGLDWSFGGVSINRQHGSNRREQLPPVCKHLLACALADSSGGAFDAVLDDDINSNNTKGVKHVKVTTAELAAWAATGNGQG